MGETFKGDVSVQKDNALDRTKELCLDDPYLEEAPFEKHCGDILMSSDTPSIGHAHRICTEPPNSTPISSLLLPSNPSHLHAFHKSVGDIRGYTLSFDPYYALLEDVPRKIMWILPLTPYHPHL